MAATVLRISSTFEGIGSFANSGNWVVRWFNSNDDSDPAAESNGLFFGVFGRVCEIMSYEESKNVVYSCRYPPRSWSSVSKYFAKKHVVETLDDTSVKFCSSRLKGWVMLSNMGGVCTICEKDGWLFATHSFTNSSFWR